MHYSNFNLKDEIQNVDSYVVTHLSLDMTIFSVRLQDLF